MASARLVISCLLMGILAVCPFLCGQACDGCWYSHNDSDSTDNQFGAIVCDSSHEHSEHSHQPQDDHSPGTPCNHLGHDCVCQGATLTARDQTLDSLDGLFHTVDLGVLFHRQRAIVVSPDASKSSEFALTTASPGRFARDTLQTLLI